MLAAVTLSSDDEGLGAPTTVPSKKSSPLRFSEDGDALKLPAGTTAAASRLLLPLPFEPFDCPRSSVTVTDGIASLPLLPFESAVASTIDDASVSCARKESSTLFRCSCWVHRRLFEERIMKCISPSDASDSCFRHRVATEQKKKKRKKD